MNAMAERCRAVQDEVPAVEPQGTPIGEFLNPEGPAVKQVTFRQGDAGLLAMDVEYVNDAGVLGDTEFQTVSAMLGRLLAVAQGIHKIPREQLEAMSMAVMIRERDMRDAMAWRGGQ